MRRATSKRIRLHVGQFISIHALHEESDLGNLIDRGFNTDISIHALHEESDHWEPTLPHPPQHLIPRSPRGERPVP